MMQERASHLTDEILHDLASAELARRDFLHYCDRMAVVDGEPFVAYRHTVKVAEYLHALECGEINKLLVFMPTQNGKTHLCSERFPAYFEGKNPTKSTGVAAFGKDRAVDITRTIRNLLESDLSPFSSRVSQDSRANDAFAMTAGGKIKAAGVDSAFGGFGAHLLVFDDPHKSMDEAKSPTISDKTWSFFTTVFMRRQRRGVKILIPTTRWTDDDVPGRILNSADAKNWTVLELPGHADPSIEKPDPLGRLKGEVLWPEGPALPHPGEGLISLRDYQAVVQQRPVKHEGVTFKRAYLQERFTTAPAFTASCVSVDGAWKEGVGNSRSAMAHWGTDGIDYFVVDAWADQLEYVDLRRKVIDFFGRSRADILCVEDAASGMALISELRRTTNIPIIGVPAKGSKEARAEAHVPKFEAHKVKIREAAWTDEFVEEHVRFPAKPNDLVDTTSIALERLSTSEYYAYATAI